MRINFDILDFLIAVLSIAVAVTLITSHTAPWKLIAAYWCCVALRNTVKVKR